MSIDGRTPDGGEWDARFYGKYEGVVTDVDDPLEIGRLRAKVPEVLGEDGETGWAFPCAPFGGGKDRGMLCLPEVGDTVWVEFAAGDLCRPIWAGVFWGTPESAGGQDDLAQETGSEVPTSEGANSGPGLLVIRTRSGHRIAFDDEQETIVISNGAENAEIRITKQGEVIVKAQTIKLGSDSASEPFVLGNAFLQIFNAHTHPTGVGPSGPPVAPMTPGQLSKKHFTE